MDLDQVRARVAPLVGQKAWGAKLGHGSFVTVEFGKPGEKHGEWHLWVYCCNWRLEESGSALSDSDQTREHMSAAVAKLDGRALEAIDLGPPANDALFRFEGGLTLRLWPYPEEDCENWMLFLPDGNVITSGPGDQYTDEPSSS